MRLCTQHCGPLTALIFNIFINILLFGEDGEEHRGPSQYCDVLVIYVEHLFNFHDESFPSSITSNDHPKLHRLWWFSTFALEFQETNKEFS